MQNDHYGGSSQNTTTDIFTDEPVVYAGFWERFGAIILDGLILIIPNMILRYTLGRESAGYYVTSITMRWLYDALQESGNNQATLGKKALGIKVTNVEGQKISFSRATGRHFGKYLSLVILFFGYLMMLWDEKRQTLHDKMAGTLVVKSY